MAEHDKAVAAGLRESAGCIDAEWGPGTAVAASLRKRADELDPPEDRATRIAKRVTALRNPFYRSDVERILREEGV